MTINILATAGIALNAMTKIVTGIPRKLRAAAGAIPEQAA